MWNKIQGNNICALKHTTENQQRHLRNIRSVKSVVNCGTPWKQELPQQKDKKYKKTRNLQIFHDNQVLLNKMMVIEQKDSQLHPRKLQQNLVDLKQDGVGKRMKDFNKINDQNQFLLKRLQSAKSEYSKDNWLKGMSKQMALKRNLKTGLQGRQYDYNQEVERIESNGLYRVNTHQPRAKLSTLHTHHSQPEHWEGARPQTAPLHRKP